MIGEVLRDVPLPPELAKSELMQRAIRHNSSASLKKFTIPTPPGTEWANINICFENETEITITVGQNRHIERNYKSFPFSHNLKNNKPTKLWFHLLSMAVHKGYPPRDIEIETTTKHVSDLKKNPFKLGKTLFKVSGITLNTPVI